jgi:hypothetical protein
MENERRERSYMSKEFSLRKNKAQTIYPQLRRWPQCTLLSPRASLACYAHSTLAAHIPIAKSHNMVVDGMENERSDVIHSEFRDACGKASSSSNILLSSPPTILSHE